MQHCCLPLPLATMLRRTQTYALRPACWLAVSVQALRPPNATCRATHTPIGPLRVREPSALSQSVCVPSTSMLRLRLGPASACTTRAARLQLGCSSAALRLCSPRSAPPQRWARALTALLVARRALRLALALALALALTFWRLTRWASRCRHWLLH